MQLPDVCARIACFGFSSFIRKWEWVRVNECVISLHAAPFFILHQRSRRWNPFLGPWPWHDHHFPSGFLFDTKALTHVNVFSKVAVLVIRTIYDAPSPFAYAIYEQQIRVEEIMLASYEERLGSIDIQILQLSLFEKSGTVFSRVRWTADPVDHFEFSCLNACDYFKTELSN